MATVCWQYRVTSCLGGYVNSSPPMPFGYSWSIGNKFISEDYLSSVPQQIKIFGKVGELFWINHYCYEPIAGWKIKE